MAGTADKGWLEIGMESWLLGVDAAMVVVLRTAKLAEGGPEACREAKLMVSEKIESSVELASALITGKLGSNPKAVLGRTVSHYRKGVAANRKRLAIG